jgi:hypothetical protein
MYPGTIFNWIDQSWITEATPVVNDSAPLFMAVGSFDKGPEDFREVSGNDFFALYGQSDFFKHGQNSIQMANIINNGGKLFVKRVVASDSKLANLIIVANVSEETTEVQRTDANGNLLYWTDSTQTETTTTVTEYPVMDESTAAKIKYEAKGIAGITGDMRTAYSAFRKEVLSKTEYYDPTNGKFPLFIITDNGRGASSKSISITPDYNTSRGSGYMFYNFKVVENNTASENVYFTANPDVVYSDTSYRLSEDSAQQVIATIDEAVFDEYVNKIADISLIDTDTLINSDIIFGKTNRGEKIDTITIDSESIDLQATNGISLINGNDPDDENDSANGAFGDAPGNPESGEAYDAWAQAIADVYKGGYSDEIYDVDQHKIVAIFDANFPKVVKEAIGELVTFREDCVFLRDTGIGNNTFADIKAAKNALPEIDDDTKYKFIADYVTSYEIKDPNTQKNIEVTVIYDLAGLMTAHMVSAFNAPLAGTYNGMVCPSAIKGTVNFTPIVTPSVNYKQAMEDLHVNYAIFEGDNCVIQASYTTQPKLSQLSYLNNVIAIQEVMRAVRTSCPAKRFSLSNGSDLSDYAKAVNRVLEPYKDFFDVLEFDYTANVLQAQQKIFYASIRFAFLNWSQTEIFDLYAINNE